MNISDLNQIKQRIYIANKKSALMNLNNFL